MLEKEHRVVAADRSAQQARRVDRVGRIDDADARAVREDALARLRVIGRAAAQVAANRHADDDRAREGVVRAVPQHRHLVADLHHRRPDVVEELNLDDRLEPTRRQAYGATDDVGLGERGVVDAVVAELALQAVGHLEDATLAGHQRLRLRFTAIGDVLAEDQDARVARHLVSERAVDGRHHRIGLAVGLWLALEVARCGIDRGRIDVERCGVGARLLGGQRAVGGLGHLAVGLAEDGVELVLEWQDPRRAAGAACAGWDRAWLPLRAPPAGL